MRILITAGPTREYIDDVRFLSNASSGKMGYALAEAAVAAGHQVVLVSGPVMLPQPAGCEFIAVETSEEMYTACVECFPACDGVIAAAAVCDYRPRSRVGGKISKTGQPLTLELIETEDVLAELGRRKTRQWVVGFALESQDAHKKAVQKLERKHCDVIVLNFPSAIGSADNAVELIDKTGKTVARWEGRKTLLAQSLISWIETNISQG